MSEANYHIPLAMDTTDTSARPSKSFKKWAVPGILAFLLILVVAAVVIYIAFSGSDQKVDCTGDGFDIIPYVSPLGITQSIGIKIFDKSARDLFNFTEALAHCDLMGAHLWQVLDGQLEWDAVMVYAQKMNRPDVWVHAQNLGQCPAEDGRECLQEEAQEGRGLPLVWPASDALASYSRFIGGDPKHECLIVERQAPHLWKRTPCSDGFYTACIKRRCLP